MNTTYKFTGFPKQALKFYSELEKNNEKRWFEAHGEGYENYVMTPARAFVFEMGERLKKIAPGIHAEPRVDKSIFRIYRDIRFSKSKQPFKTHLGVWFWDGTRPRMDCSGFYFQLEPRQIFIGAGLYRFPNDLLAVYRKAVVDDKLGPKLTRAINKVLKSGRYEMGGSHYKRVPRGFDPDHKRAELLKHNTLYVGLNAPVPKEVHSRALLDYCFEHCKNVAPVHRWLQEVMR